ncbi:MAG: hypothetical protein H7A32_01640 [Deltaproteobacteria bacterium]|nr:hypothetical protein [Deltaproteobacteria bacterium]
MTVNKEPAIKNYEDFKRRVLTLPEEQQLRVLKKAFDIAYEDLDDKVWRAVATAIKYAKESGIEGHENFDISEKDLKKLTHIQDAARRQKD